MLARPIVRVTVQRITQYGVSSMRSLHSKLMHSPRDRVQSQPAGVHCGIVADQFGVSGGEFRIRRTFARNRCFCCVFELCKVIDPSIVWVLHPSLHHCNIFFFYFPRFELSSQQSRCALLKRNQQYATDGTVKAMDACNVRGSVFKLFANSKLDGIHSCGSLCWDTRGFIDHDGGTTIPQHFNATNGI